MTYTSFYDIKTDELQTENWHLHPFEIQPRQGGRFGYYL